jgi:predicted nucleic acid-binding protein
MCMADPEIPRVLWDTTVYINYFSRGVFPSGQARGHLFLSSVVIAELYAGVESVTASRKLDLFFKTMSSYNRLITPSALDWRQAGKLLSAIGQRFGFEKIGRSRLTNDVLIAISAARANATLCTANAKDFQRIAEFLDFDFTVV